MKKFIFFFALLILSFSSFSNDQKEESSGTQIVNAVFDKTEAAITKLCEKLSVPANQVWEILVRQQIIEGRLCLIALVVSLVVVVFLSLLLHYMRDTETVGGIMVIIGLIVFGLITAFSLTGGFIEFFPHWMNPQYGAIQELKELL